MAKIVDEKTDKGVFAFHSTKCADMYQVIADRDFTGGAVGGQMLGPGFYTNYFLSQAGKHQYGKWIFMTKLLNTEKFLIVNSKMYYLMTGKKVNQSDEGWIKEQFEKAGIPTGPMTYKEPFNYPVTENVYEQVSKKIRLGEQPSAFHWPWWFKIKAAGFHGIIYDGGWDAESFVCWHLDDVIPIAISSDGKNWVKPHTGLKEAMDQENHELMREENMNSTSEYRRSMQRAYDTQLRATQDNWTEDQIVRNIRAQIERMQKFDQYKVRILIDAFATVFPNLTEKIED